MPFDSNVVAFDRQHLAEGPVQSPRLRPAVRGPVVRTTTSTIRTPDEITPSEALGYWALKQSPWPAILVAVLIPGDMADRQAEGAGARVDDRLLRADGQQGLHDRWAQVERCSLGVWPVLDHTTCSWLNRPRVPRRRPTRAPKQAVLHHLLGVARFTKARTSAWASSGRSTTRAIPWESCSSTSSQPSPSSKPISSACAPARARPSSAPGGNCASSSPNCPTDNSGNSAACMPRASIPSAISPSSSPSQDQPSIAHSTGALPLSVRFCPLPESPPTWGL